MTMSADYLNLVRMNAVQPYTLPNYEITQPSGLVIFERAFYY